MPNAQMTQMDRDFLSFHANNPWVYVELVKLAREALKAGRRRIGMKMIWEVARWNRFIATTDEKYKLNNNYHSRYARLIMAREQDLRGVFNLRDLRS